MVQLHSTALTTKATENNTITRRNQQRSTSFSENAESKISGLEKEKILPVFVFPLELHFHPNDVKSLTQTVKIYNPYSWPIKFKFLVKTARLWEISEPGGVINSDCFYDVCVRLLDRSPSLIGKKDYLRVSMQTITESLKLGVRDLPCLFLPGERVDEEPMQAQFPDPLSSNADRFTNKLLETPPPTVKKPQEIVAPSDDSASSKRDTQGANKNRSKNEPPSNWPPSAYVFTAIMCGIILCLPTEECILPTYLVISHTPKYIAAYVLGIITSILCKYY